MICFRQICKNAQTETRKCDKNEETQMWNNAFATKAQTRKCKNMQKRKKNGKYENMQKRRENKNLKNENMQKRKKCKNTNVTK